MSDAAPAQKIDETPHAILLLRGWSDILRLHADEADKACNENAEKWITDKKGWETLRDQLRQAAQLMDESAAYFAELSGERDGLIEACAWVAEHCNLTKTNHPDAESVAVGWERGTHAAARAIRAMKCRNP